MKRALEVLKMLGCGMVGALFLAASQVCPETGLRFLLGISGATLAAFATAALLLMGRRSRFLP